MTDSIEHLMRLGFAPDQLLANEPMARHTTMRVGGPADLLVQPSSAQQVQLALAFAAQAGIPALVIGNGSNLIVRDGGIRGLVIQLGDRLGAVTREGNALRALAGAKLSALGAEALRGGLTGLEFAAGIPGTVGGGAAMNAGAYGGELKDVLVSGSVLVNGQVETWLSADFGLGYRTSRVLREGGIVLDALFALTPGDPDRIAARMADLAARRRDSQPLSYPSSGSTFKRPEGHFAGALIERAGLKGRRIGGAMVSEKHAGFVVNAGGATARDVLALIEAIQDAVARQAGVNLACEVRVVGEG